MAAILVIVAATTTGCDSAAPLAAVEGRVTYNGQPLEFGGVMLQPEGGQPARGTIQSDGTFVITTADVPGAVLGTHKIRVTCFQSQRPDTVVSTDDEPTSGDLLIPRRYTNYGTSDLTFDVKAGEVNELVIELVDEKNPHD
jgi:hypothetical protein